MYAIARAFLSTFPCVTASMLLAAIASAGPLSWESTEVSIEAPPLAESVEASFKFTNTSENPVTIAEVHSSCGCTVPHLDQKLYAPGESGTIRAIFTVGERIGLQEKAIMVTTAKPDFSSTTLTLKVQIPTLYDVKPFFVIWNRGDAPTPKSVRVAVLQPEVLQFESATSRHTNFTATTAPVEGEANTLAVTIAPQSTAAATNGSIELTFKTRDGRTRLVALYALIRDSRPPTPPAGGAPAAKPATP